MGSKSEYDSLIFKLSESIISGLNQIRFNPIPGIGIIDNRFMNTRKESSMDINDYVIIEVTPENKFDVFDTDDEKTLLCTCPGPMELAEVVKSIILRKMSKTLL